MTSKWQTCDRCMKAEYYLFVYKNPKNPKTLCKFCREYFSDHHLTEEEQKNNTLFSDFDYKPEIQEFQESFKGMETSKIIKNESTVLVESSSVLPRGYYDPAAFENKKTKSKLITFENLLNYIRFSIGNVRSNFSILTKRLPEKSEFLGKLGNHLEYWLNRVHNYKYVDFYKKNKEFIEIRIRDHALELSSRQLEKLDLIMSRLNRIPNKKQLSIAFSRFENEYQGKFISDPQTTKHLTDELTLERGQHYTQTIFDQGLTGTQLKVAYGKVCSSLGKKLETDLLKKRDHPFIAMITAGVEHWSKEFESPKQPMRDLGNLIPIKLFGLVKVGNLLGGVYADKSEETEYDHWSRSTGTFLFSVNYKRIYRSKSTHLDWSFGGSDQFGSNFDGYDLLLDQKLRDGDKNMFNLHSFEKYHLNEQENNIFGEKNFVHNRVEFWEIC